MFNKQYSTQLVEQPCDGPTLLMYGFGRGRVRLRIPAGSQYLFLLVNKHYSTQLSE